MFEEMDINDMLKGKKPKKGKGEEEPGKPNNDDNISPMRKAFDQFNRGGFDVPPTEEEIAKVLSEKFGGEAHVVRGGMIAMGDGGKQSRLKFEGVLGSLIYIAEQLKLPTTCKDANGTELVPGDILKIPGGEVKTVLKVGWRFCILSRTDSQTTSDGAWFETQINDMNFIKKV